MFGTTAIRNSLILFNAMFAVQTAMDLLFLWGGVRLPDGMTHADYAHRGAYPLIFTALLAGAFVLAAMRKDGPGERSPLIRNLVYLWIAQNVWLVISSILRLKIYVDVYSLSELRLAAFLWMGLVAVGLVLIVVRIARGLTNRWLVVANLTALGLTLYAVAWIDTPAFIARYNVERSYEVTGQGVPLDLYYIDDLGPAAIPAIDAFLATQKYAAQETINTFEIERGHLEERLPGERSWQGWSWRQERLDQYLAEHPYPPTYPASMK